MLTYPNIDPVAISLGPLQVHWYGLMYLLAFLFAWGLATFRAKQRGWTPDMVYSHYHSYFVYREFDDR
jgi:phosphatidylglycerol---prolipoprotein diacylglyceryl transferase